jgi:hypothetical protein
VRSSARGGLCSDPVLGLEARIEREKPFSEKIRRCKEHSVKYKCIPRNERVAFNCEGENHNQRGKIITKPSGGSSTDWQLFAVSSSCSICNLPKKAPFTLRKQSGKTRN